MASGPEVAWARLRRHHSPRASVQAALTRLQRHLPAAATGGEQVSLLPGHRPQRQQWSVPAHSCDVFHVKKPRASLSNWSRKLSAHQLIHEDVTPSGLKGPGGRDGKFTGTALSNVGSEMRLVLDRRER